MSKSKPATDVATDVADATPTTKVDSTIITDESNLPWTKCPSPSVVPFGEPQNYKEDSPLVTKWGIKTYRTFRLALPDGRNVPVNSHDQAFYNAVLAGQVGEMQVQVNSANQIAQMRWFSTKQIDATHQLSVASLETELKTLQLNSRIALLKKVDARMNAKLEENLDAIAENELNKILAGV